jgi:hypothetical protein
MVKLSPLSFVGTTNASKPLGVCVMKVGHAHEALRSLCILDKFFNHGPRYAIRIFADDPPTSNETLDYLQKINPLVDLQFFADKEQNFKQLPPEFSELENCTVNKCTRYVFMGYGRYRRTAYHDSLQGFEYFISWDTDAYLTQPLEHDPFQILHQNNLTGFYVTDNHNDGYDQGSEQAATRVFGNSIQGRGYLNSLETFSFFSTQGQYSHRSILQVLVRRPTRLSSISRVSRVQSAHGTLPGTRIDLLLVRTRNLLSCRPYFCRHSYYRYICRHHCTGML